MNILKILNNKIKNTYNESLYVFHKVLCPNGNTDSKQFDKIIKLA